MILLLGGSGYVGRAYQRLFLRYDVPHRVLTRAELDYSDPERLISAIRYLSAEFVINAAGYTGKPNVDACEYDKAECLFGNAVLPGRIREACEATGVPWGHVSSGCIYNGAKPDGSGFREDDAPNFSFRAPPCSFYSGTKALGEEVLADAQRCYIWRLRIPFHELESPRNYLTKLMRYERLLDARNSLSQLDEFAAATCMVWQRDAEFGIYNVTNPGSITAREITQLLEETGVMKKDWQFFSDEDEFMREAAIAPRSNCVLDTSKMEALGIRLTPVIESVRHALEHWDAEGELFLEETPAEPENGFTPAPEEEEPTKACAA
jgi:dTDP-4-dehydrorhamnose reductase